MAANDETPNEISLPPKTIVQLHETHYAIVDNFLPKNFADTLLQDAEDLFTKGLLTEHLFSFGGELLKKPNVFELDLSGDVKSMMIGSWIGVLRSLGPAFLQKINCLDNDAKTNKSTRRLQLDKNVPPAIKLQVNNGGGSFPLHYDNPGPPNKRFLTCVVYLNPSWSEGDGGEIVLWPFLGEQIIIPPLHQRAVLFYSDCMLHKVLPLQKNKRRVCFTIWCNGLNVNANDDVALSKDHLQFTSYDQAQIFFASSPLQRVISRAVYSEEYLESLLQCLGLLENDRVNKDKRKKLTLQHESSISDITSKLKPLIEEFRKRKKALYHNN